VGPSWLTSPKNHLNQADILDTITPEPYAHLAGEGQQHFVSTACADHHEVQSLAMAGERLSCSSHLRQGCLDRGAPCEGELNDYASSELLGMSSQEIKAPAEESVI
jgi:hypothetical protein